MIDLNTVVLFTWGFSHEFFLESDSYGNWVWSHPDYPGGDNTIRRFSGSYKNWCRAIGIPYGRDKGYHKIGDYCGPNVVFK